MVKNFFVLRVKNKDLWIAHRGSEITTAIRSNIHVYTKHEGQDLVEYARVASKCYKLDLVAEEW